MQSINILTLFKQFIDSVISEQSLDCFKLYCLGGMYTYEEYTDSLSKILKNFGENYSYKNYMYTERYSPSKKFNSSFLQAYAETTSFFVSEEKKKFIKYKSCFNFFIANSGFPFIVLPKMYSFIESCESSPEFCEKMIILIKEWKQFFWPYIIDFCSFKEYYIPMNNMYVYSRKNEIVISDSFLSKIKVPDKETYYLTDINTFSIHHIINYD